MAKAAKKAAPSAKTKATSAKKPEKKAAAAPKKEAAPKAKKEAKPVVTAEPVETTASAAPAEAPVKETKKQKAARVAQDKVNAEEFKKWSDLKDKYGSEKAVPYNMTATFEANRPLLHKVLGWGYILSNQNDRLEVLFETGPKMLISNYKPR